MVCFISDAIGKAVTAYVIIIYGMELFMNSRSEFSEPYALEALIIDAGEDWRHKKNKLKSWMSWTGPKCPYATTNVACTAPNFVCYDGLVADMAYVPRG